MMGAPSASAVGSINQGERPSRKQKPPHTAKWRGPHTGE
jgi:hypothetical protein